MISESFCTKTLSAPPRLPYFSDTLHKAVYLESGDLAIYGRSFSLSDFKRMRIS